MSPVDAIRPPLKKKRTAPPAKRVLKPVAPKKGPVEARDELSREKLRWILVASTAFVILMVWIFAFHGGLPKKIGSASDSSAFGHKLANLWTTVKTDILKIKSEASIQTNTSQPQSIEHLEQDIFPQFKDPTKQ